MVKLNVDQALLKAKFLVKNGEIKDALNLYQEVLHYFQKIKEHNKV